MTDPVSHSDDVELFGLPVPAVLLGGTLVIGLLLCGAVVALGGPPVVVRDGAVGGTLLIAISGYSLTRVGRGEPVHPLYVMLGAYVCLWLVLFTVLSDSPVLLSRLSVALGVVGVVSFGALYRVLERARRR